MDNDNWDEWGESFDDDRDDPESACIVCGDQRTLEECCCCGAPLCPMHYELGAGFCRECPTKEWCEEQESMAPDETGI